MRRSPEIEPYGSGNLPSTKKYRKVNEARLDQDFWIEMAACYRVSVNDLMENVLKFYEGKKLFPFHPTYEARHRERQSEDRQHKSNLARVNRQTFAAGKVVYRRPLGRPPLVAPHELKRMKDAWAFGKQVVTPPCTGVEIYDFVALMQWDFAHPKARKGPRPKTHDPDDPRGQVGARMWRAIGNVELIRKAPDGKEISTLWTEGTVPPVDVLIDPDDDPWTHRLTPIWYSQPSLRS